LASFQIPRVSLNVSHATNPAKLDYGHNKECKLVPLYQFHFSL